MDKHNIARCECYTDRIVLQTIRDGGLYNYFTNKQRTIFYDDITSITVSEGPKSVWSINLGISYIQFHTKGSQEISPDVLLFSAKGYQSDNHRILIDNNAMFFPIKGVDEKIHIAKKIQKHIEDYIQAKIHSPSTTAIPQPSVSVADEIIKYKQLLDSGIINKDEFDAAKKQLLNM